MMVNTILNEVGFCKKTYHDFVVNDETAIPYICCTKSKFISCAPNECSQICDKCYAKYLIIDLTNIQTKKDCEKTILNSFEDFENFQKEHISKLFFFENLQVRYNIYLIFVINNEDKLDLHKKITEDMNYARKLVLSVSDLEEYFLFFEKLNISNNGIFGEDQEILIRLRSLINFLYKNGCMSILLPIEQEKDRMFNYILRYSEIKTFDEYNKIKMPAKEFMEKYIYKEYMHRPNKEYLIKTIEKVTINNFRENCFGNHAEIGAGKINVFFGENAAGKSSILDAIEYGFTGKTHKNRTETLSQNSHVKIFGRNNTYISSNIAQEKEDELRKIWYSNKIGSLNELFCRVNYFDTDATYRFAVEEGDAKEAFWHIRKLLCNSKLLDIKEILEDRTDSILNIIDILSHIIDSKEQIFTFYESSKTKNKPVFKRIKNSRIFLSHTRYFLLGRGIEKRRKPA